MGEAAQRQKSIEAAIQQAASQQGQSVTMTVPQGVAFNCARRSIAVLMMDAEMCESLGEAEMARALKGAAEHLDKSATAHVGRIQRVVVPTPQLVVPG
jgi:hypothetical protein